MFKKILSVILCLVLCLSMVACDGDNISISGNNGSGGSVIKGPNSDKIIIQKPTRPGVMNDDSKKPSDKEEPTKPVEDEMNEFDTFSIGKEVLSLKNISIKDIKDMGFGYTESWTVDTFMNASGTVYTNEDGEKLYVATDKNKQILAVGVLADLVEVIVEPSETVGPSESEESNESEAIETAENQEEAAPEMKIEVSIENASNLILFNGLKLGMTAEAAIGLFNETKIQPLDDDSEMYATHSDEYSIIFGINEGVVSKLYLAFGKKVGLNLSAEEKLGLIKEQYNTYYKELKYSEWPGYADIINCNLDINAIIINDSLYDFNALTINELINEGFYPREIVVAFGDATSTTNFPVVLFENDTGSTIKVVFDKSGNIEYLYSNASCISLFGDIKCDAQTQMFKDVFESVGVEVKDDGYTIIKSTKNTLIVGTSQGNIISIQCVNNEKVGYPTNWY